MEQLKFNTYIILWKAVDEQVIANYLYLKHFLTTYTIHLGEPTKRYCLGNLARILDSGKICWLSGIARMGKAAVANTVCAVLDRGYRLGANFFCSRLLPECRYVRLILHTIAYQLAHFSRPFRNVLSQTLERDHDVYTRVLCLSLQFDEIIDIIGPLREVARTLPTDVASFPEYILDQWHSNGDPQVHNWKLAALCLGRIRTNKRQFNICELECSYVPTRGDG
ncbi:hypothetical protein B0J17DRAFT_427973 [Rhizoctonia solani]|nr:hypothetical protein B0J17DRAFT_427973 [Rhizoctonia solani]